MVKGREGNESKGRSIITLLGRARKKRLGTNPSGGASSTDGERGGEGLLDEVSGRGPSSSKDPSFVSATLRGAGSACALEGTRGIEESATVRVRSIQRSTSKQGTSIIIITRQTASD